MTGVGARSIQSRRASSQGALSSSDSATPADILARFTALWKSSPSATGQSSRRPRTSAIVVLPEPATPITTNAVLVPPGASLPVLSISRIGGLLSLRGPRAVGQHNGRRPVSRESKRMLER